MNDALHNPDDPQDDRAAPDAEAPLAPATEGAFDAGLLDESAPSEIVQTGELRDESGSTTDAEDAPQFKHARTGSLPLDLVPLRVLRREPDRRSAGAEDERAGGVDELADAIGAPGGSDVPAEAVAGRAEEERLDRPTDPSSASPSENHVFHASSERTTWEPNAGARDVAIELKRVEMEIRELLERCDIKRKRRYDGTRRWLELLEDLVVMRHSGPANEATLRRVETLVARRQHLFHRLNFIVGTRHRWNT